MGTVPSDLLILINRSFSPAQPTSSELKSGHLDGLCWLLAGSRRAHGGHPGTVYPLRRGYRAREQRPGKHLRRAGPQDQAGQVQAPGLLRNEPPPAPASSLQGGKKHVRSRRASSEGLTAQERQGLGRDARSPEPRRELFLQQPYSFQGLFFHQTTSSPQHTKWSLLLGPPWLSALFRWVLHQCTSKSQSRGGRGFSGTRTALQGWAGVR